MKTNNINNGLINIFIGTLKESIVMPKIKTVRSAAKRFKKTASGKFKHKQANLRHLLTKKKTNRKRHLRSKTIVSHGDMKHVISLLPYV